MRFRKSDLEKKKHWDQGTVLLISNKPQILSLPCKPAAVYCKRKTMGKGVSLLFQEILKGLNIMFWLFLREC